MYVCEIHPLKYLGMGSHSSLTVPPKYFKEIFTGFYYKHESHTCYEEYALSLWVHTSEYNMQNAK